jgi:hypothetical protein
MTDIEFQPFPKIARLNREVIVTEKIDGTNALIYIADDCTTMMVGSRTRWIKLGDDNFGFAVWAEKNRVELLRLGPGYHYGEWWGAGIQRKYGMTEKRFSLFNTTRWLDDSVRPVCCHVVPILATGSLHESVLLAMKRLRAHGSVAAPGFMQPEGIVAYHTASGQLFKVTLEGDESPKGKAADSIVDGK